MGRKAAGPPTTRGYVFVKKEDPDNQDLWIRCKSLDELPPEFLAECRRKWKRDFFAALGKEVIDLRTGKPY